MLQLKSLHNQLAVLQITFDEAIMKGHSFEEVKKIYVQIKVLERALLERQLRLLKDGEEENP